ncbi:DNA polymerase III subunit alpha, partial [candidate division KSB3 bacterium]
MLSYVREKYGADHVAQIITFGTMAARAAVRDAGRALGLPYGFCDQVAKIIPEFTSIDEALADVPDFKKIHKENDDARELIDTARRLEGLCRHSSVHACGVVITDKPVVEYTALQRVAGDDEATVTQYASSTKFSAVEKIGLLKMDFLGLKNLTIIQNTLRIVKKIHNIDIDIEKIPLDDHKTYTLLQNALTTGVFQLESSGMKRYLKALKPTVLEDIIAMVALYRPGPMEWIPDFIDGKHGTKQITYLHPKLEAILADTYGVAVYQEQVMRIAQDLAGFTLGEADILRKAMGKKIVKLIKEQKIKFVDGCVQQGVKRDVAEKVFSFIEPFAGYGFNRSHAACYGLIGYQTAYLKAHYPAEFMAALMTSDQGNTDRIAIEAAECRDMGIDVLPPDINESFEEFAVI